MVYPYGLQNFPAVGGGSPGLPRRQAAGGSKPSGDGINPKEYRILVTRPDGVSLYDGEGSYINEYAFTSPVSEYAIPSLDFGQELFMVTLVWDVPQAERCAIVFDTKDLSVVAKVGMTENLANSYQLRQGAISTKAGVVSFASTFETKVFSLSDFLAADGGDLVDLTPIASFGTDVTGGGGATRGIIWNPQGTLLALFRTSTNARALVHKWPSLDVAFEAGAWADPGRGAFTGDGKGLAIMKRDTSSSTDGDVLLYRINYDENDEYLSNELALSLSATFQATSSSYTSNIAAASRGSAIAFLHLGAVRENDPTKTPQNAARGAFLSQVELVNSRMAWSADNKLLAMTSRSSSSYLHILKASEQWDRLASFDPVEIRALLVNSTNLMGLDIAWRP